jgi:putative SOS response-associated peptidase YedK
MDPKFLLANAKAETAAELRTFKKAFASTRCLVPANGFYDYRKSDPKGSKRRYLFEVPDVDVYAMAGLWQERNGVRQFTIVTTEPNDVVKEFHHRMPVILAKADCDRWLDPAASAEDLQGLLRPWAGKLTATEAPKGGAVKAEAEPTAPSPRKAPVKQLVAKKPTKKGTTARLMSVSSIASSLSSSA